MSRSYSHAAIQLAVALFAGAFGTACDEKTAQVANEQVRMKGQLNKLQEQVSGLKQQLQSLSKRLEQPANPPTEIKLPTVTLKCPEGWHSRGRQGPLLSGCEGTPRPSGFTSNCNVTASPATEGMEAKDYFQKAFNTSPQLQGARRLQEQDVALGDLSGYEVVYEHFLGPEPLTAMATIVMHDNLTFAITCTAPRAKMPELASTFRSVTQSVELGPKP